jgi:hypothetical protein
MTEKWRRRVLYVAAGWNIVGALSALADPAAHFTQLYTSALTLTDPVQTFFFRAVWINAIAWGVAYTLAARFIPARVPILLAGGAGKLAYCGLCIVTFQEGGGTPLLLGAGGVDLLFAAFFAYCIWNKRGSEVSARV